MKSEDIGNTKVVNTVNINLSKQSNNYPRHPGRSNLLCFYFVALFTLLYNNTKLS